MSIFRTNPEAVIYVILIGIGLYVANRLISFCIGRIKKVSHARKNSINFFVRVVSIIIFVYFIVEGFPSFTAISTEYTVIITGAVSTAIAFATSEVFSNFISGILIWILDPFDIGDVVKIKDHKGVIKSITFTKVIIETFDRIIVEISNSDMLGSTVLNYTIKLKNEKNYYRFKRQVQSPQQSGNARLDSDIYDQEMRKKEENELRELHKLVLESKDSMVHSYTFTMRIPYDGFRIKVDKMEKLCEKYKDTFDFKPTFHIYNFTNDIHVKFRILTLKPDKLLNYQADFANDLYKIILSK